MISVILTSYNHEHYLRKSIESVLCQTYKDYEFIIVDDCSQDTSWEIICEYKKMYPHIITIRHTFNWGGGSIEDIVVNVAKGEYIAIHHSDDIWEKDKLQKQVDAILSIPDCAAVFTNAAAIDDAGNPYKDQAGFYYNLFNVQNRSRHEWLNYFFYKGNCLCHPSVLIRKDAYMEDGFFRKGLRQIPDYVKWIQLCKKHEIFVIQEPLVKFRIHAAGKNTSGIRADTQIRSTIEMFLMLREYLTITDRNDFLRIFPDARQYCTEDFFSVKYALGRICTEPGMKPYTRLFGIQLLYEVLNDPALSKAVADNMQYNNKTFKEDNGKVDIFGLLPQAFEQKRTIYYDIGQGYNNVNAVSESFTLGDSLSFEMNTVINLSEDCVLKGLRFDPAEGVMISACLSQLSVNGTAIKYIGENALYRSNNTDYFINLDPIYSLEIPEGLSGERIYSIKICGSLERLTSDTIGKIVPDIMYQNKDLLDTLKDENAKNQLALKEKDIAIKDIKNVLKQTENNNKELMQELLREKNNTVQLQEKIIQMQSRFLEVQENLQANNKKLDSKNAELDAEIRSLKNTLNCQKQENQKLNQQIEEIHLTIWGKAYKKFKK